MISTEKSDFMSEVRASIAERTFIRIKFGKYKGGDPEFENAEAAILKIKNEDKLSFKFRYKTRDEIKNFETAKGIRLIDEITGKDFFSASLFTSEKDLTIDYSKKGKPILHKRKHSGNNYKDTQHNRVKHRYINSYAKYFHLLGVTSKDGKVLTGMYDKFRQVDKFIEIVDSLYRASELRGKDEIRITDMGSGKSYITFALYDYFENTLKKKVFLTGIEQRKELVSQCSKIAEQCGFERLKFESSEIYNAEKRAADITIALHACDTATDDAIVKAIESDSSIIVLAPCCHKYLRKKLKVPGTLRSIFRHGILEDRLAVMLTDGLRALTLESFDYDTKVFEFVSHEHTAKNIMITGVKKAANVTDSNIKNIKDLKSQFGIDDYYLDLKLKTK